MAEGEDSDSESVTEAEGEDSDPDTVRDAEVDFVAEAEGSSVAEAEVASILEAENESVLVEEDEDDSAAMTYTISKPLTAYGIDEFDLLMVLPADLQVSLYASSAACTSLPQSFLIWAWTLEEWAPQRRATSAGLSSVLKGILALISHQLGGSYT